MEQLLQELLQKLEVWRLKITPILFQIVGSSDLKLSYQ